MAQPPKWEDTTPLWEETKPIEDVPKWEDTTPTWEATQPMTEPPTMTEAAARGAASGITMGFADELEAAWKAGAISGPEYEQEKKKIRGEYAAAREAFPKTTFITDLAASLLIPVPGASARAATTAGKAAVKAVSGATKIKKAAMTGAALGAAEGMGRSEGETIEEVTKDTLVGLGLGGVAGGALSAAGVGINKFKDKTREKISANQAEIFKGAQKYIKDIEVDDKALAEHIAGRPLKAKKAAEVLDKANAENSLQGHTARFKFKKAAEKYIEEEGIVGNSELSPFMRKAFNFMSDAQFVYDDIDTKWGTTLTPTLNKLSGEKYNLYTYAMKDVQNETKALKKLFRKATVSSEEVFDHINYGKPLKLTNDADKQLVSETKRIFEDMRRSVNDLGLPVKELTRPDQTSGYVTNALVDKVTYKAKVQDKLDEVLGLVDEMTLKKASKKEFGNLRKQHKELDDLVRGLKISSDFKIKDGRDMYNAINQIYMPKSVSDTLLTSKANAMLKREDNIPDFLLEKDITKLMNRWASNTYRHALFRDEVGELTTNMLVLQKLDPISAQYIERHINDILGKPTGIGSLAEDIQSKAMDAARRATSPRAKKMYETFARLPDAGRYLQNQVYANYLGLNPRANVRNLTQMVMMTTPEMSLAGPKAAKKALGYTLRGYAEIADSVKNNPSLWSNEAFRKSAIGKELKANGWLPESFTGEGRDLMRQAILDNSGLTMKGGAAAKDAIDRASEMAMTWYEKTDLLNRAGTLRMSKHLAKDFLAKDEAAQAIVGRMPKGYRIKIDQALKSGNDKEVGRLIADHFLASTQFNYNRVALSEFGRWAGPIFSMFTKWPTSIAGDMVAKVRRDGAVSGGKQIAMKYGTPWAALAMADAMLEKDERGRIKDPRTRELVGSQGLKSWAPVGAGKSVVTGEVFEPPALGAAKGFVRAATSPKEDSFINYLGNQTQSFAPGGWIYRIFMDDMPHYMGEEK